jgi:hypothetical protein
MVARHRLCRVPGALSEEDHLGSLWLCSRNSARNDDGSNVARPMDGTPCHRCRSQSTRRQGSTSHSDVEMVRQHVDVLSVGVERRNIDVGSRIRVWRRYVLVAFDVGVWRVHVEVKTKDEG